MVMSFMKFSLMAFAVLGLQLPANAQSVPTRETPTAGAAARRADITAKERINAWTVGLAGGLIEGAPLRLAAEIARVVNEADKLHVIPIVTGGATENVNSLPRSTLWGYLGAGRPKLHGRKEQPSGHIDSFGDVDRHCPVPYDVGRGCRNCCAHCSI